MDSSFHQRNTKINRDHPDLSKDTGNIAGPQTLTLYHTLPVKMGCIVQHVCCFTQKPRDNNQVCLVTRHTQIVKTLCLICKNHSWTESHRMSKAKMDASVSTYIQPSSKISFILCTTGKEIVEKNGRFLTSIVKCLEFCGRKGLALRGHRDDDLAAPDKRQQGNLTGLLDICVNAGDQVLQEHLEMCSKKVSYIPKTKQNELLESTRHYVQDQIIDEIKAQSIGPKFSVQADDVTDMSNKEQIGLTLRYVKDGNPIERLVEYIMCESITGAALCEDI